VCRLARCRGFGRFERKDFSRQQFALQLKAIKVIAAKRRSENATNLIVIASDLEFLNGATNRQIVDEDLGLIEGAVGDAGQFSKFEIA